ncbi:iron-siderophore ABC transporter substrate-binding protein [Saccharothrix longispora]|uniref:iron-siderophore ABC transporter substrate-binding protein n=1 Tax=Saccharothrix longispora TaxID=33920 RepID=UPI0028FD7D1D|nr:iron-siderophore ABC transporter substrate-binding protein [Saccharothrix longispora]MBY8847863.1 iron-siderophore ABC transporter substrate-binding protein [Saccharothrix sp. MB29]MDU0287587.1 iron-siderophore ABC transporter substrate-binding protein [Saccharothrix longispora]
MRSRRLRVGAVAVASAAVMVLGACSSTSATGGDEAAPGPSAAAGDSFPVTVEHALGSTTIPEKPERIATVAWANHEVPLALGIVPVGMAKANFGDDDTDGMLPWVSEKLQELKAPTPVLFDETDGIDFEAVADTEPDVILAPYSGLTQEDYTTLSAIAPVVAYPKTAWATPWRDSIRLSSKAIGRSADGDRLISDIEKRIDDVKAKYPQLQGKSTMFMTHFDTTDLSQVGFYTTHDTRAMFFEDLGLTTPGSIARASAATDKFSLRQSTEQIDAFDDVDIVVGYGDEEVGRALAANPLLSKMRAVANGSVVMLSGSGPAGTAANPTPMSVSWVLDQYAGQLAAAADKVK